MPALMPAPAASLTFPIAALARLDAGQPAWLRECVAAVQDDYLRVRFSVCASASREQREFLAHEAEAVRELLVDAWLDALCPLPVFFAPNRKGARN